MNETLVRTGAVYWITGLSGVGKTTVGGLLKCRILEQGIPAVHLDGDVLREVMGAQSAHSEDERRALAFTYVRLCKMLADQGLSVVCSTMSLFEDVRVWGRQHAPHWIEVHLVAPLEVLHSRDPKGLYAKAAAGEMKNVAAVNMPYEAPSKPDIAIVNDGSLPPEAAVAAILSLAEQRGLCRGT